jgi:hypothetical protein
VSDPYAQIAHVAGSFGQTLFDVAAWHEPAVDKPVIHRWITVGCANDSRFKAALRFEHMIPRRLILDDVSIRINHRHCRLLIAAAFSCN